MRENVSTKRHSKFSRRDWTDKEVKLKYNEACNVSSWALQSHVR